MSSQPVPATAPVCDVACSCGCGHNHGQEEEFSLRKELIGILPPLALLALGLIFRSWLATTPYALADYAVFLIAYFWAGWQILWTAARNIRHGRVFDEYFLMAVATIAAIAIGDLPEAVGVMLFFRVGELFQDLSVSRSRRSIQALLEVRPDYANLKRGEAIERVHPDDVAVGSLIVVNPGEKIPLDGEVTQGTSSVDTSPLTGESMPRPTGPGETVLAGTLNTAGVLTVKVTKPFAESSVSKILGFVENASARKAPAERFITTFARYYTPAVVGAAVLVAAVPPLFFGGAFSDWIYRACVLLIISCPCALVISIPVGYFGGIGGASRQGILIKGANYLDTLTRVKTVVFDKTGTLTKGKFKVIEAVPAAGYNRDTLLALAGEAEAHSNHPIAGSIIEACENGNGHTCSPEEEYQEIPGCGVRAKTNGKTVLACHDRVLHEECIAHDVCDGGGTTVHLAVDQKYAGHLVLADELKVDAIEAIGSLRKLGVSKIVMLTGDGEAVASLVARRAGVDSWKSGLLPEGKLAAFEEMAAAAPRGEKIAFVGDGINDAPVIARADVGIAMGAMGADAAIETADVVIMTDHPSKVPQAIRIARRTRTIVWQNIGMALGIKGLFLALGTVGIATLWGAVFADVGVAVLAILNATRSFRQ